MSTSSPKLAPPGSSSAAGVDLFNDFGNVPEPEQPSSDPLFDGIDVNAPASSQAAPAAAPAQQAAPAARQSAPDPLLDFLGPEPQAPDLGVAPAPRRSTGGMPVPGARPQAAAAAPGPQAQKPVACRACNKPLTDPFDQAIGTCEDCRQKLERSNQAAAAMMSTAGTTSPSSREIELPALEAMDDASLAGAPPLALEPRSMGRGASAPALAAEPRSMGRGASAPALAVEPRSGMRTSAARPHLSGPQQASNATRKSGGRGVLLVLLGLVLIGGGSGAAYYFGVLKPQQAEPVKPVEPVAPPPIPAAIQAVLPRWEMRYLSLSGSSVERLESGAKHLARDQRGAYADAEEDFQQALLLDPRSDAAIAGYVQALALGRGSTLDKSTFDEALSLIQAAEERGGRTPMLLLAHANLLMSRPNQPEAVQKARELAEETLKSGTDAEKAEAHLVLGRAFLQTSMGLANQHFDAALELAPNLQRVHYHRALAHEAAGAYSAALEALKGRLEKDPEHWDSLATMARIYLEVGELEQARKLYESRRKGQSGDVRVMLPLAVMHYQVEGNAAAAVRELRALLKGRARLGERDVAEMFVHLAAAERMAGNTDAGAKAAEEALKVVKELPAAHLQLFLVALGRGDVAKAATHLAGFQGNLEDVPLEKVLAGRLRLAEKKPAEALELFQEAVRLDSRRQDALLLAGIASAGAGRRDDAFRLFFQALQSDPLRLAPRPVTTLYFLRPGETLSGTEGSILALASGGVDVAAPLYEGLLLFHIGDRAGAERLWREVLELDPNNVGAAAYNSLLALQRGEVAKARALSARAVAAGRQQPIGHLASGLALAEARQVEPAKRALRDTLTLAPTLLSAEVKLAELEMASSPDSARARLAKVVGLDPAYLPAKRLLFIMEKRG
jgi:tetratricopeptide (TPR) repeat protein